MLKGCIGKMLYVDLSTGDIEEETPGEELYRDFLGGYGIGARIIFSRQEPGVDPLGPSNTLGFVTGILTGTPALFGSRYTVVAKSPLTGTWGDANSGGDFGPHLKFAGYDAVFFTGIAEKPVYLFLQDGKAELRDAKDIWGKDTNQTEDMLKAKHGRDTRVACIGPAGEQLSLISGVITNKARAAARSGLGAVMGAKKLKAIAVKGTMQVPLADVEKVEQLRRKYLPKVKDHPLGRELSTCGTTLSTGRNAYNGRSPVRNWGGIGIKHFPNAHTISFDTVLRFQDQKYGCWRCPVACGALMKAGVEYNYAAGTHRPEYETACSFGTLCLNNNYESIIMANDICSRYGLDTISAGSIIAFAIECYENGLITKEDTEGVELKWGDHRAIVAMTEKLARRDGFGAILADGVKIAAERIGKGATSYAIHVGGQEVPYHDPKKFPGLGLSYIIDATPGRHTQYGSECERKVFGREHKRGNTLIQAYNAAGLCIFSFFATDEDPTMATEFLSAITGYQYSNEELLKTGERISNIRQAFNIREGINALEQKLPDRVVGIPPQPEGPNAGVTIDLSTAVKEYLEAMDWDLVSGKPSGRKLQELGLEDVSAILWPE
jgi:aldehyde:ferredoxin oxidoreductase